MIATTETATKRRWLTGWIKEEGMRSYGEVYYRERERERERKKEREREATLLVSNKQTSMNEKLIRLTKFRVPFVRGLDRWRHARLRVASLRDFGRYAIEILPRISEFKRRMHRMSDHEKG